MHQELAWLTAAEQQAAMTAGEVTAVQLCELYLQRIRDIDRGGPRLRSVLETSPEALGSAAALDAERAASGPRSALHGVCVLLKDNIDTDDQQHTTAGSLALVDSRPRSDATIVTCLKEAGAVILGKANLSEWANFRGNSSSGWSGRGGQCLNPHVLCHTPSGSSSGSGSSVAAALTAVAIGSETDGSIISPSTSNGIVGIKPTVGLLSRHGIIPISGVQDTAGPMTRCVADAAALLSAMAAPDKNDPATAKQPADLDTDYVAQLLPDGLRGARIGILRSNFKTMTATPVGVGVTSVELLPEEQSMAVLEQAIIEPLRACGAVLVDDLELWAEGEVEAAGWKDKDDLQSNYRDVMPFEFRRDVATYLRTRRVANPALGDSAFLPTTLQELFDFNLAHADEELQLFGQESWEAALASEMTDDEYAITSAKLQQIAGPDGIDKLLAAHGLDALVCPTSSASYPASMCGYPIVTVPAGVVRGQPFGCAFIGSAFSESTLVRLAYSYEQATGATVRPEFRTSLDDLPAAPAAAPAAGSAKL
jgi:amidase